MFEFSVTEESQQWWQRGLSISLPQHLLNLQPVRSAPLSSSSSSSGSLLRKTESCVCFSSASSEKYQDDARWRRKTHVARLLGGLRERGGCACSPGAVTLKSSPARWMRLKSLSMACVRFLKSLTGLKDGAEHQDTHIQWLLHLCHPGLFKQYLNRW